MRLPRLACAGVLAALWAATVIAAPAALAASSPATPATRDARRLEDIHIEGEVPVPQVLFITEQDQRRYLDFQHRRYLETSFAIGRGTVLPTRIQWVGPGPVGARKETAP